jgi:hypothetical protein
MKTLRGVFLWGVIGAVLITLSGNVQGSLRPVGDNVTLSELQGVFDGIGSNIDAVNNQTTEDAFMPTGNGLASAGYVATVSYGWAELEFGIYNLLDTSQTVKLFDYSVATPGDSVALKFDAGNDLVYTVSLANPLNPVVIDSSTYFMDFGFYAITYGENGSSPDGSLYSQDFLNNGSYGRMLTYEGQGDLVSLDEGLSSYLDSDHWYVAAEAGAYYGADPTGGDFTDMVVQMESIAPSDVVPEPASVLLMASTAVGIAFARRRFAI